MLTEGGCENATSLLSRDLVLSGLLGESHLDVTIGHQVRGLLIMLKTMTKLTTILALFAQSGCSPPTPQTKFEDACIDALKDKLLYYQTLEIVEVRNRGNEEQFAISIEYRAANKDQELTQVTGFCTYSGDTSDFSGTKDDVTLNAEIY